MIMKSLEDEENTILCRLHMEASKKGRHLLSLRAFDVIDFSSQYGGENSLSYTADNILGPPSIFPRAGDHAYAFQLRTYGEWWNNLPSGRKSTINLPYGCPADSQDFIEFAVEKRVSPVLIRIYEVYNPGAIVKVLCYHYENKRWVTLWQGEPQSRPPNKSHCFSFSVEGISFLTDYYRIEFHHRHLKYYFELDGLILYGEDRFILPFPACSLPSSNHPNTNPLIKTAFKETLSNLNMNCLSANKENHFVSCLDLLPREVLHIIVSFLDLRSLCSVSKVSKIFRDVCCDPVLYKNLNLQLYWHQLDAAALKSLEPRLTSLKNLNISWCGGQGRIMASYFIEFLETKCQVLTSLNISSCPFVNNNVLRAIASYCFNLQELEMRCCRSKDLTQTGFKYISEIQNLIYLDMYRTQIDTSTVITIINSCVKLEHLFLGSCTNINAFNEVARAVGQNLKTIKTLDLWRASSLTCLGIFELAEHCCDIVELDLGWCYKIDAGCGCIRKLVSQCQRLKKLFLTAIRSVTDNELNAIASYCPDLEQLDLLGTNEVTGAAVRNILLSCKKLMLIDVSYCDNTVKMSLPEFHRNFPNVAIKYSIPPDMMSIVNTT